MDHTSKEWEKQKAIIKKFCDDKNISFTGYTSLNDDEGNDILKDYMQVLAKPEEEQEDYFNDERFQYYLDLLSLQKEEVAELNYTYQKSFWTDSIGTFDEFITSIQFQINSSNFYEVDGF